MSDTTYNLASLLEKSAEKYPDREAIVLGDTRMTYAQVNGAANMVANLLVARGIQHGDKVALSCANLPYFTIIYYGILKAGASVVPLNVLAMVTFAISYVFIRTLGRRVF